MQEILDTHFKDCLLGLSPCYYGFEIFWDLLLGLDLS